MSYLGKVVSSLQDLYSDVTSNTGAVDIVCVRQQDGSLKSTPFHVRFGKVGDLKEVRWNTDNGSTPHHVHTTHKS